MVQEKNVQITTWDSLCAVYRVFITRITFGTVTEHLSITTSYNITFCVPLISLFKRIHRVDLACFSGMQSQVSCNTSHSLTLQATPRFKVDPFSVVEKILSHKIFFHWKLFCANCRVLTILTIKTFSLFIYKRTICSRGVNYLCHSSFGFQLDIF